MARSPDILDINYMVTRNLVYQPECVCGSPGIITSFKAPITPGKAGANVNLAAMAGDFNEPRKNIKLNPGLAARPDGAIRQGRKCSFIVRCEVVYFAPSK